VEKAPHLEKSPHFRSTRAWQAGYENLGDVVTKINNLQTTLLAWEYEEFGNVRKELKQLHSLLEREHRSNVSWYLMISEQSAFIPGC
jgi:archaellum biogenesis protein FlaJ (TadC family)